MNLSEVFLMLSRAYSLQYIEWYLKDSDKDHPEIDDVLIPIIEECGIEYCRGAWDMFFALSKKNEDEGTGPADYFPEEIVEPFSGIPV